MKNNSTRILAIAVILLLAVNGTMLYFMLRGRGHGDMGKRPEGKGGPIEMMIKEMGMNDQQQKDFQRLKDEHFNKMKPLADSIRAAKTAFFSLVKDDKASDSLINAYEQRIRTLQTDADKMTFSHFRTVRALFTAEQQKKFDEFVQKMMQRPGPGGWHRDTTRKQD